MSTKKTFVTVDGNEAAAYIAYAFSGWNAATYIIGEMRDPEQNLPRALLAGTLIVLVLYVALNAVFLHTAPIGELAGQLDVARISGSHIFGETGGRIVGASHRVSVSLDWSAERATLTFALRSDDGPHSSGRVVFGEAAA